MIGTYNPNASIRHFGITKGGPWIEYMLENLEYYLKYL